MTETESRLHEGAVFQGFWLGLVIGVLAWLWYLPRSGTATRARIAEAGKELRETIEPTERLTESIAAGKAIAQQHRQQRD
jgi:gas vesicle protein